MYSHKESVLYLPLTHYSQCLSLQLPEYILKSARFDLTARIKLFDLFTEARTQENSTNNQTPTRTHTCTLKLIIYTHMATNHITARIKLCYFHEQPKSMQIFVMHKHMIRRANSTSAGTAATATTITITTTASSGRAMGRGCKLPGCQAGKKGREIVNKFIKRRRQAHKHTPTHMQGTIIGAGKATVERARERERAKVVD